ncbi:hypothetical protein L1049_008842 [Liquidambar formosana]|uniref:Nuclease HARBI1 n=1 Tax=Liquidambar formosana TaxID=63359 RepID=A0AAP0S7F7_LIQFO
MRRSLFLQIVEFVEAHDPYFVQKRNAAGVLGLLSLQKVTATMRMLTYGLAADAVDDYVRIGESTTIYLRSPNNANITRLLAEGERRGFLGMLRSIDCMHWKWKNCLVAWKGMCVRGDIHNPSIILEAVASYDLWIWHAFFGLPRSHNDINVLERSHLFANLAEGRTPATNYSINGHNYTTGYYLADGIYPPWSTFVKTIPHPQENKHKNFATTQESIRKDVKRAFGVLQACFAIVRGPSRFWDAATLKDIMIACIIMHNIIVEDEHGVYMPNNNYEVFEENVDLSHEPTIDFVQFLQNHQRIRNREAHSQLQADLIEYLW